MLPLKAAAASLVPSLEEVMPCHFCMLPTEVSSVQFAPELVDVQIFPSQAAAASLVPSLEEVMPWCQAFVLPTEVSSVQLAPKLVEVQMFPSQTAAASLVPSLEEVMPCQFLMLPTEVTSVQFAPEWWTSRYFPSPTTAASLVPSLEEVMLNQYLGLFPGETSLQTRAALAGNRKQYIRHAKRTVPEARRDMAVKAEVSLDKSKFTEFNFADDLLMLCRRAQSLMRTWTGLFIFLVNSLSSGYLAAAISFLCVFLCCFFLFFLFVACINRSGVLNQLLYLINTTSRPNMWPAWRWSFSLSLFLNTLLSLSVLLPVSSQPLTGRGSQALDIQEEWLWQSRAY